MKLGYVFFLFSSEFSESDHLSFYDFLLELSLFSFFQYNLKSGGELESVFVVVAARN